MTQKPKNAPRRSRRFETARRRALTRQARPVSRRSPAGRRRAGPGRKLGGGLAGNALAGTDGYTASADRRHAHYVARFDAIADYLARWQPPSLLLWGRHDAFFDLAEILSWMRTLPRMEAHVFDAGHMLLETHAAAAVSLMLDFIRRRTPRDT